MECEKNDHLRQEIAILKETVSLKDRLVYSLMATSRTAEEKISPKRNAAKLGNSKVQCCSSMSNLSELKSNWPKGPDSKFLPQSVKKNLEFKDQIKNYRKKE